ncbi:MAG: ABC transporter ATP-binding protein [bacterium]|nr:ABC transporter ATP-binding protein [bacterium]
MKNKKEIIKIENVSYRYKDAKKDEYVFKNLSFDFELGKVYAIKGKSGSGKTTLLSLICGFETNYEGKIFYDNKDLSKIDLDKYRNSDIGIVFQSYNLLPHLTAAENIILSMDINGIKNKYKEKYRNSLKLLEDVGLTKKHGDRRVLRLSGGEQQRVAIARSLSYNPKVIIADEPTGNLDKDTEEDILNIFKKLAKDENKCVIIVTHSENVCKNSDIVYELKKKQENKDGKQRKGK